MPAHILVELGTGGVEGRVDLLLSLRAGLLIVVRDLLCLRHGIVIELAHSASLHACEKTAPSNPGIKQLGGRGSRGFESLPLRHYNALARLSRVEFARSGVHPCRIL